MGICYQDARMLWRARLRGVSFRKTATLGHLSLFLHPREIRDLRRQYRSAFHRSTSDPLQGYEFGEYCDRFLREFLDAHSVSILDCSPYEGATVICDLNEPVPENLNECFDAVIDGGTLEHIFNFPVAVENLMRMTGIGGRIFMISPANNLCGHGFYQFSPELVFRVFGEGNGFVLHQVLFVEAAYPSVERTPSLRVYEVVDPLKVGKRVPILSKKPILMMVEAEKLRSTPSLVHPPLQSDYVARWGRGETRTEEHGFKAFARAALQTLPPFVRRRIEGYREIKRCSLSNSEFYKRILD